MNCSHNNKIISVVRHEGIGEEEVKFRSLR